jgi:hypothetical protein
MKVWGQIQTIAKSATTKQINKDNKNKAIQLRPKVESYFQILEVQDIFGSVGGWARNKIEQKLPWRILK